MKSMFKLTVAACLFSLAPSLLAEMGTLKGTLSEKEGKVLFSSKGIVREVVIPEKIQYSFDKKILNSPNYIMELKGDIEEETIKVSQTPTIFGGVESLNGFFTHIQDDLYSVDGVKAKFGRTKPIYGIPFDAQSKRHYINKEVNVQGEYREENGEKIFFINAILEKDLISAKENIHNAPEEFKANPFEFVLNEMPKNEHSQKRVPFRGTLAKKKNHKAKSGDNVLIITLSGRQGDAPGSAGGHFAIGMGKVQDDLSIKGETFNFYFEGPKEVLAGNTDLISYFGHLIQGQQNYRPTYTVYVHGISQEDLKKVRDDFEIQLNRVRVEKGLEITPGYNCTTTSNYALRKIGIYGKHHNLGKRMLDIQNLGYINPFSWGANNAGNGGSTIGKVRVVSYVSTRDPEHYVPRNAFESFIKNFESKRWRKRKGITQVDYVFIPQTPSRRQVGGISYNEVLSEGNKIIKFSKERKENIDTINKALDILLSEDKFSKEEVDWARNYFAADQAKVKEVLDTID